MRRDATVADGRRVQALALLDAGQPIGVVAKAVGVDRSTLHRWRNGATSNATPDAIAKAATSAAEARVETLTTMAEGQRALAAGITEATEKLFEKMRSAEKDADQIKAACEILDRAGLVKQSHLEVSHTGAVAVDVSDFRARIERAYEAAKRAQSVEVAQGPQGAK